MDFWGGINLRIRRSLFAVLIFLSAVCYHSGLIPRISSASAMIMVPLCVAVSLHEKSLPAMGFGILCGALWDLGTTQADGYYTVMLAAVGFISSSLSTFFVRKNLMSCLLLTLVSVSVCNLGYWGFFFLRKGYEGSWQLLFDYYLPSAVYTLIFGAIFYYVVGYIVKNTKEKKKH